ncbi:Ig-like domain repeat protein [Methanobrevibacter sp.]|uniref:Ig-like domain repeat protein n=1 Tax=Methanobrevibacter sp. TaxID=66852 RepID=UPI00388FA272
MKNTKKIGVLISLLLISIIALGAVSAAEDVAVDDADVAVEEVVEVNDAPATNEIDTGSEEIVSDSDSEDLQDQSDATDEVVADDVSPKNNIKADALGAEPDGSWADLYTLINGASAGSTITLDRNYVYNTATDAQYVRTGSGTIFSPYEYYGLMITKNLIIDGAGFTIDGSNQMRAFDIYNGASVTLKNINFINCNADGSDHSCEQNRGGAIYSLGNAVTTIDNCSFVNCHAADGGVLYVGSGTLRATHCEFYNNTATRGGVFYQPQNPNLVSIKGSAFINNTATNGNNGFIASGVTNAKMDYNENWWGENHGPQYTMYMQQSGAYFTGVDYYVAEEILTSPITIEVKMRLDSNATPTLPLEPRHASIVTDVALIDIVEGWVPEAFTINFTTSEDAYINVTIDNQLLVLKVFAGENKKNITLDVTTADVTLPAQPVVTLTSDVDGIFNLTLGDQVFEVNVVDGVGVFDFAQEGVFVDVGKYTIIASRVDDPVYKTIFRTAEFEVKKYLNELTIEADKEAYTFGDDVTITPTFTPEGPTGTVTYFVDGATSGIELDVDDDLVLSGLAAGEHNVVAKYGGDGKYGPSESEPLTFTIAQAALEISVADVTVNYPDKGTVEVKANVDGKYTITVNDKDYEVIVVDGVGTFDVTEELDVGTYDIEWDIEESENYTAATGSAVYKVDKTTPTFLLAGDEEYSYGDEIDITTILNSDASGYLTFTLNDEDAGTINVNGVLTLKDLDAGHYTLIGNFPGDTNYGPATATLEFDVLPIDVIVTVETTDVAYPNTGSVSLTASAPGTYTIKIGDKTYTAVITEEDETVTVPVTDVFAVGKYPVTVTAPAHDNYKEVLVEDAAIYTVTKAQAVMTITYDAEADEFTVTLDGVDEKLSESYHILIDTEEYGEDATVDGVDTFDIPYPGAGKHSAFVIFDGNDNYLGAYAQTSFDLPKLDTAKVTVSAEPTKETFPGVIEITLVDSESGEKLNGTVVVTIDETDYAVDVKDGEGTLTVNNLPAKTYPITAKFVGNDEYEEATGEGELLVNEWNEVIIVISPAEGGASATLIDVDMNNINGVAQVTVDGNDLGDLPVVDGKVDIPIEEEGDHVVTVYFAGDDEHPAAGPEEETIYVGTKLIPVTMTVVVADITYTEDAEAVVTLVSTDPKSGNVEKLSGVVKVQIGDKVQEVTVTNGEGSTVFSGLTAGGKNAIATFESDGVHDTAVVTTTFNVAKMGTKIVCRNMTTTAINVTEDGRIGQYFYWNLYDAQGRPLVGKPVSIGFNANVYNRTTDANGQARLQINLQNAGTYTFAISFLGDENYEGAFEVAKIIVNRQKANLTASGATYKASAATKTLSATYKTKAGKAIVGKTIKFTVNGKTYSAKTDANGVAKVNVSLTKAGSYTVEVKAPDTNTYAETIKKVTLKLT